MGLISGLVDSADGMLDSVASSTFGTIVTAAGTTIAAMATLAIVLTGINIIVQYRPFHPGQVLVILIKLVAITAIGLKWGEFYKIASAVESAMNGIGSTILGSFSGGGGGDVSNTLAESVDRFISDFSNTANTALEPLSWMAGALMSVLVTILLALIGCAVGLALIFSKVMITVYLSLAPIFIALWMFDATKDYFHRWLQSTVTYMLYPVVIATVLGGVVRLVKNYIDDLSASPTGTIAEFIPFIAALLVMIVVVAFIPFIVNSLSGTIAAPGPGMAGLTGARMVGNARAATQTPIAQKTAATAREYANLAQEGGKSLATRIAARSARF